MTTPMTAQALQALCTQFPFVRDLSDAQGLTVITGPVRLRYAHFDKPSSPPGTNKEPRYNCLALVPDMADWSPLEAAAMHAWQSDPQCVGMPKHIPWQAQTLKGVDKEGKMRAGFGADSHGANGVCFSCETKNAVELFDMYADPADPSRPARLTADKVYPGCWVRLKVRAFAYSMGINSGVKFWLQSVQKIADDKVLSNADNSSGFSPLAPAGAGAAQMPSAFGAPAAAPPPAAAGFGQPAMPAAAAGGWGRR